MAKNFSVLRAKMPLAAQARAHELTRTMLAEMPLNELRQARGLTQATLASLLHVEQPSIAKMEKRTDMYLSTLRNLVQAMGGDLVVTAKFPDGEVRINNFSDLGPLPEEQNPKPLRKPKQPPMRQGAGT
jgi:transcriptional regulator with XRE-family HTH domain